MRSIDPFTCLICVASPCSTSSWQRNGAGVTPCLWPYIGLLLLLVRLQVSGSRQNYRLTYYLSSVRRRVCSVHWFHFMCFCLATPYSTLSWRRSGAAVTPCRWPFICLLILLVRLRVAAANPITWKHMDHARTKKRSRCWWITSEGCLAPGDHTSVCFNAVDSSQHQHDEWC